MFTIFPELVRSAWSYNEERLAILLHSYFGKGHALKGRSEFEEFLSKIGIILCYDSSLDAYGALLFPENRLNHPVFCIKKDLEWSEQRFLIAHLLGHFLFDNQVKMVSGTPQTSPYKEINSPLLRYLECRRPRSSFFDLASVRLQWISDEFAGALLLPKPWLQKFVENEKEPLRIAAHFSLSLDFLHARIKHIRQRQRVMNSVQGLSRKFFILSPLHASRSTQTSSRKLNPRTLP